MSVLDPDSREAKSITHVVQLSTHDNYRLVGKLYVRRTITFPLDGKNYYRTTVVVQVPKITVCVAVPFPYINQEELMRILLPSHHFRLASEDGTIMWGQGTNAMSCMDKHFLLLGDCGFDTTAPCTSRGGTRTV